MLQEPFQTGEHYACRPYTFSIDYILLIPRGDISSVHDFQAVNPSVIQDFQPNTFLVSVL